MQCHKNYRLTPKQEKFCVALLESDSKSDAFRKAYNPKNWSAKSINEEACRISNMPKISSRVNELMQPIINNAVVTRESHLARLAELSEIAVDNGQLSAAVVAETNRGKCAGLYTEKLEVTGKLEDMTEDELRSRLAYLMEQNKGLLPG